MPKSRKKTRTAKKDTHEAFGVMRLKPAHPAIKKLKKKYPTSIHGDKFWSSSYLLMDYLTDNPLKSKKRVMEIGCGWGLASVFCAKTFGCKVTGVDADPEVFPYLQAHAKANKVKIKTISDYFENLDAKILRNIDVIIGADICFWDELADTLFKLIKRAEGAGVQQIIIADPERSPFEDLCDRCDDRFTHTVWDWSLPKPTQAEGQLLVVDL